MKIHPQAGPLPGLDAIAPMPWVRRAFTAHCLATLCGLAISAILSSSAATHFVHDRSKGRGDGTSWSDAFTNLHSALAVARFGDSIHVAEGTYTSAAQGQNSFRMVDGVQIFGGYSGSGADPSFRDIIRHRTLLSGNGSGPVVMNENVGHRSVWDGFTITGGNADRGGGMYNRHAMVVVRDCIFDSNNGGDRGGGVFNESSSVLFDRCEFRGNNAFSGGGIGDDASSSLLIDCLFEGNQGAYDAGAIFEWNSHAQLSRCVFRGNWVWDTAGALGAQSQSRGFLVACTFEDNIAEAGSAGAIWNRMEGDITLDRCVFRGHRRGVIANGMSSRLTALNCLFVKNTSDRAGGVIDASERSMTIIESCTFASNTAPNGRSIAAGTWGAEPSGVEIINSILWNGGNEIWSQNNSTIRVQFSTVAEGYPGTSNSAEDPQFVGGDNYRLKPGSPCIDRGDSLASLFHRDLEHRQRPADGDGDGVAAWDQGAFERSGLLSSGPLMTFEPADVEAIEGSTLRLVGAAVGTPFCTYQWQKNDSGWVDLSGEMEPRLILTNLHTLQAGRYRVVARDITGSVTSAVANVTVRPVPGVWVPVSPMMSPRYRHTATVLADGRVLVTGGETGDGKPLASALLFDPGTDQWTTTGSLNEPRVHHEAILLPSGKVLVAGGMTETGKTTASAELYDPVLGLWTRASAMSTSRSSFTVVLMNGSQHPGKVLAIGGNSYPNGGGAAGSVEALVRTELYDSVADRWSPTADLISGRILSSPAAVPFADGSVLVVGYGTCCPLRWVGAPELTHPDLSGWESLGPKITRATQKSVLLSSGEVLVAGGLVGIHDRSIVTADAEIYDPVLRAWRSTGTMSTGRRDFTLTQLPDGEVLAAGGSIGWSERCRNLSSAELYNPANGRWTPIADLQVARALHTASRLLDGQVLIVGGQSRDLYCSGPVLASAELFVPRQTPQPPILVVHPSSQIAAVGMAVSLQVVAVSLDPPEFQWTFNGQLLPGETTGRLILPSVEVDQAGVYAVEVRNAFGKVTSHPATLTVLLVPPDITTQPGNLTLVSGHPASLTVTATGSLPLTCQWRRNGFDLCDDGRIAGAQTTTLSLTAVGLEDLGVYTAVIRNAYGSVTSAPATLTVLLQPPDLTSDPLDQSVLSGADASFSVTAVGSLPLSYQWQRNGVDLSDNERISGSQTATLRIMGAAVQDLGLYGVTVRNSYGWTVSFPAQLTVALAPPTITREPQGSKVALGSTVSLQVQATGSLPLTYQWQRDGVNLVDGERLSGSRTSLLTLSDLRSADLGNYSVVVENALGRRHSASVSVETSSIELMIQKQGTAVVLSWSPAGQGAMLQTSGSLAPPEWRDVEGSESVTRMVLPLPPHASAFFRLMGDDLNFNQSIDFD